MANDGEEKSTRIEIVTHTPVKGSGHDWDRTMVEIHVRSEHVVSMGEMGESVLTIEIQAAVDLSVQLAAVIEQIRQMIVNESGYVN